MPYTRTRPDLWQHARSKRFVASWRHDPYIGADEIYSCEAGSYLTAVWAVRPMGLESIARLVKATHPTADGWVYVVPEGSR